MALELRQLTPNDLGHLMLLDHKLFPPIFHMAEGLLESQLIAADLRGRNHSVGAFDQGRLVGYIILIRRQSELNPEDWVFSFVTMAIERAHRREAVVPMLSWAMREACLSGEIIEGTLRETTSYRMVLRCYKLINQYGFRIIAATPRTPVGAERMILLRFEHILARDHVLRPVYRALTRINCARCTAVALPRRILRRACEFLSYEATPRWLRRVTFMEVPAEGADSVSA
jgi:hypothetical protein